MSICQLRSHLADELDPASAGNLRRTASMEEPVKGRSQPDNVVLATAGG